MASGNLKKNLKKEQWLHWLGRYVPVRHRYILTRAGRLRLRYVVSSVFCLALAGTFLAGSVTTSRAVTFDSLAAVPHKLADDQRQPALQKRLQRYAAHPDAGNETEEARPALSLATYVPGPKPATIPRSHWQTVKIGQGNTLAGVLQKVGVSAGEAYKVVKAMESDFDPRKIRPGQEINVRFDPATEGGYKFSEMRISLDEIQSLSLTRRADDTFESAYLKKDTVARPYAGYANIKLSLYGSAAQAGIPAPVIAQAIHIYSWDVDFQRDIRKGDKIEVMYEQLETRDGQKLKNGDILYARLNVNGQDIPVYRFEAKEGDVDYYTPEGVSIRKALMQTPIDGARLSSGYGKRHHPVLGYAKMHKGVDFAAPRGTPIYAAGDGTIEKAGRWSSYGNYVRIRHNASLKTAYAHLKGFAKGISAGTRVKQGQVIGYVGTTGRSTGPHLHYEVLKNDRQVNPKTIKLPQGETLTGSKLAAFKKHIAKLDRQYAALNGKTKLASRQTDEKTKLR